MSECDSPAETTHMYILHYEKIDTRERTSTYITVYIYRSIHIYHIHIILRVYVTVYVYNIIRVHMAIRLYIQYIAYNSISQRIDPPRKTNMNKASILPTGNSET